MGRLQQQPHPRASRRQPGRLGLRAGLARLDPIIAEMSRVTGQNVAAVRWPLPNVWLGTSVEDQRRAEERIPELLATSAAVRFLSCEPLLGPIDLHLCEMGIECNRTEPRWLARHVCNPEWVIVGGESGPGARPMDLAWARSLVRQCQAAGVAVFCKQLGAKPTGCWMPEGNPGGNVRPGPGIPGAEGDSWRLTDRKGGNPDEWPKDLQVRQFPEVRNA